MIRSKRLTIAALNAWLVEQRMPRPHKLYRLRVWRENRAALEQVKAELKLYIDEGFSDARLRLRRGFEDDLSPFIGTPRDPAANYPAALHRITLQGYFGETLAALAVEHWGAHGQTDWIVPAFLFRLHDQEFQHLELINEKLQTGQTHDPDRPKEIRPGRTGDDGLAFRMNEANEITEVLTLEAKCLSRNNNSKIKDAHQKLAQAGPLPPGIRELINLLSEYDTPAAKIWLHALLKLRSRGYLTAIRHDGVAYICAHTPSQEDQLSWMPVSQPHSAYTANRKLEGMEIQLAELTDLIQALYRGE